MPKQQNFEMIIVGERRRFVEENLLNLSERELVYAADSHFKRQPIRPGEAGIRNRVAELADKHRTLDAARKKNHMDYYYTDITERAEIEDAFAKSRIRQTPLMEGSRYDANTSAWKDAADTLQRTRHLNDPALAALKEQGKVAANALLSSVSVQMKLDGDGCPTVVAPTVDGGDRVMGHLPDKFLKMNPNLKFPHVGTMQIVDFSADHMKNVNACVIMDVDPDEWGMSMENKPKVLEREPEPDMEIPDEDEEEDSSIQLRPEDLEGLGEEPKQDPWGLELPGLQI